MDNYGTMEHEIDKMLLSDILDEINDIIDQSGMIRVGHIVPEWWSEESKPFTKRICEMMRANVFSANQMDIIWEKLRDGPWDDSSRYEFAEFGIDSGNSDFQEGIDYLMRNAMRLIPMNRGNSFSAEDYYFPDDTVSVMKEMVVSEKTYEFITAAESLAREDLNLLSNLVYLGPASIAQLFLNGSTKPHVYHVLVLRDSGVYFEDEIRTINGTKYYIEVVSRDYFSTNADNCWGHNGRVLGFNFAKCMPHFSNGNIWPNVQYPETEIVYDLFSTDMEIAFSKEIVMAKNSTTVISLKEMMKSSKFFFMMMKMEYVYNRTLYMYVREIHEPGIYSSSDDDYDPYDYASDDDYRY